MEPDDGSITNDNLMGDIVDDQGNMIVEQKEDKRYFMFKYMYNNIIGYRVSKWENSGLLKRFSKVLYTSEYNDKKGATLHLTTNNEVQRYCYRLLDKREGAVVVLERDTGKIIALAQSSGHPYNVQTLDIHKLQDMSEKELIDQSTEVSEAVGSTFKPFIAALMVQHGKEDIRYLDKGHIKVGGLVTSNNNGKAFGDIGLQEALIYSSNVYFINAGVNVLGKDIVSDLEEKFLLNQKIETDLGELYSIFPLLNNYSKEKLGQTSFGQGEVTISPLHLAMMYQGLATGSMKRPYIVEKAETKRGKVVYTGKVEELSKPFDKKVCQKVSSYLKQVTEKGYHIDPTLNIRAKTGTATITKGVHHTYVASYDNKYVVVISDTRAVKESHEMAEKDLPGIYEKLHKVYQY